MCRTGIPNPNSASDKCGYPPSIITMCKEVLKPRCLNRRSRHICRPQPGQMPVAASLLGTSQPPDQMRPKLSGMGSLYATHCFYFSRKVLNCLRTADRQYRVVVTLSNRRYFRVSFLCCGKLGAVSITSLIGRVRLHSGCLQPAKSKPIFLIRRGSYPVWRGADPCSAVPALPSPFFPRPGRCPAPSRPFRGIKRAVGVREHAVGFGAGVHG